ncbi:MAG: hypothetical protein HC903_27735 [Methylacidiphilales bacterium]|nr:hypothetical protein [Candidatus Methylacidiphilales bacterium]NJR19328.1 hypothetical protein [Calothrix sp. CSU_2_0]
MKTFDLRIGLAVITAIATIVGNAISGLTSGSYAIGSNISRIDARLEYLNKELSKRDEFINYRIDNLGAEIKSLKEGKK